MTLIANEHQSKDAAEGLEIFLQSGDFYFGNAPTVVSTVLHSRTVITFWHPKTRIGGMCHITLPDSSEGNCEMQYGDCAITEFAKLAHKYNTPTREYEVRVYAGAGTQTADLVRQEQTLDKVHRLLKLTQFNITEIDAVAGLSRKIKLDMSDGKVIKSDIGNVAVEKKQAVSKQQDRDEFAFEIFLYPGDLYFGRAPTIVSTLLGSCVAVTLWHPTENIGGMCHVVLPELPGDSCDINKNDSDSGRCNMRYADCAICEFAKQTAKFKTKAADYEVHIYGGSDMFPHMKKPEGMKVGDRNIEKTKELLKLYKFNVKEIDAGGSNSRKIKLDLSDGSVDVRKTSKPVEG